MKRNFVEEVDYWTQKQYGSQFSRINKLFKFFVHNDFKRLKYYFWNLPQKKMSIFSKLLDYYRKLKKKIEGRKYFYFQIFHSPYENFCKVRCLCYLSVIDLHKFCIVIVLENFATSEIPFECSIHYLKQFGDFCYLRRKWLKGWGR